MFVHNWLEENLTPLPADSDVSIERWLMHSNYPDWRRKELLDKYYKVQNKFDRKYHVAKCFIKDETYPDFKHARGIYSRTDEFKCFVGPIFKLIEEEVYQYPAFIKHVPVALRPQYIKDMLDSLGEIAEATDYTAYESQFRAEIMDAVEMQLYKYMTRNLPDYHDFVRHLNVIRGGQKCEFKYVGMDLETCRLSGEMCTSLGNGFSNLMFAQFVAKEKGCSNLRIVVEGDDGLMKHDGPKLTAEDFAPLGLTIKLEHHDQIETASFCGIIFDSEELINIDDPRDVLATFGWGNAKYAQCKVSKKLRLLRCKALSLAHQYPGCPIISELAHYGLRVTRSHNIGNIADKVRNKWWRDQLQEAIRDERKLVKVEPGPRSRALVERMYGISIDVQIKIEEYLRNKTDSGPISHPLVDMLMAESWSKYSSDYVRIVHPQNLNRVAFPHTSSTYLSQLERLVSEKDFAGPVRCWRESYSPDTVEN
jgi:hypothetical protein